MTKDISVLVDSYNLVCQNASGGVKVRIENFEKNIKNKIKLKKFDKWADAVKDYDVVHVFKSSSESWSLLKYAHANNIPVVVSSVVPSEKRWIIKANHYICKMIPLYSDRYMNELVLANADAICAQTEKEKKFLMRTFRIPGEKITVIPNGISLEDLPIADTYFEEKTGINSGFILQVGRFDENKNQLNVIRAVKGTDMTLVLIGGPDRTCPEYYEQCKKEAGENVHFLGWVDHDDPLLQAAYRAAHTVILPSHKEIFGNSLVEGGACGANLVVSKALPIWEWGIKELCLQIDPKSVEDIKKALQTSVDTPKNQAVADKIRNLFSWDKVTDAYIRIYEKVINERK